MSPIGSDGSGNAKRRLVATIAGVVIALDAGTKAIAAHALAGRGVVDVLGGAFHFELYRNFAGPGNTLQGHPMLVSVLSVIAVVSIVAAGWSVRTTSIAVALGLLLGGGIGNLLDRLLRAPGPMRGGVVDWIKPTLSSGSLNVADISINAAVIALLVGRLTTGTGSGATNGTGTPRDRNRRQSHTPQADQGSPVRASEDGSNTTF